MEFKDAIIAGECLICSEEIQLGEDAYYDDNADILLCSNIICLEKHSLDSLGIKYGEVNEEGRVD